VVPPLLQYSLLALELFALAFGCVWLCRFLNLPGCKAMGPASGRLAYWPVEGFEVALLVVLVLLMGAVSQGILSHFLGESVKASANRKGLELAVYGFGFHGGGLLAWPVFYLLRRRLFAAYNTTPPVSASPASTRLSWPQALAGGALTVLTALPLVAVVSLSWNALLNRLGLPGEPQDLIATFNNTQSPLVLTGMFLVACVLAPLNEEMLFRRGLYHFLRQRFGRIIALVVSACFFGAIHQNLAGFLPLATLGVILALAYERTGDIRVPIVAHALFNLNTIIALLAGLSE